MAKPRQKVSIGVPVYNGSEFILRTLESLAAQTFTDFRVIICDNASTDSTRDICESFAAKDDRFECHANSNNFGAPYNYNKVFNLANGEYFKWAAADDLLAPRFLQVCVESLDNKPDVILAYPQTQIIGVSGEILKNEIDPIAPIMEDPLARFLNVKSSLRECNAVFGLIRREVLARSQLIGSYMGSDGNLLAELALHGKFELIDEQLFFRREHPRASSWDKSHEVQAVFWAPIKTRDRRPLSPTFRGLYADHMSIFRAPISPTLKLRAVGKLVRRAWWGRQALRVEISLLAKYWLRLRVDRPEA